MYTKGSFCDYLSRFQVDKGNEFTHTSIIKPSGAFYISGEEFDTFMAQYKEAMKAGEDLYVTEKHRDCGPFVIDFDFRFEKTNELVRKYTPQHVKRILELYMKHIENYIELSSDVELYVLEKPSPSIDKELLKDGIHIMVPDIVTRPSVQFMIRNDILKEIDSVLGDLHLKNPYENVVDEAVIFRYNWQMYGSKKPNCTAYAVTMKYVYSAKDRNIKEEKMVLSQDDYVDLFSIRNKYVESKIKIEKLSEIKEYETKHMNPKKNVDRRFTKSNNNKNECENLDFVRKIVNILSSTRADDYENWIRVGWCLRNIDYRLLPEWIEFSKKSTKFEDGACEKYWNYMRDDGLGIGTLMMWARNDNPTELAKILDNDLWSLIKIGCSGTHHDIAKVVHCMYKYDYVCTSIKLNSWYEFKNHRWIECESGHSLRSRMSTDIANKFRAAAIRFNSLALEAEDDTARNSYDEKAKKMNEIVQKLKMTPFKDNILKECRELFYVSKFEEKLDSRCHLIGFENGVYDLEMGEFREGRPEDYISFTTHINYVPYDPNNESLKDMISCISKILVQDEIRNYVFKVLASFLNGDIHEEKFHIWTGVGANGKSVLISLFESAFGDYCCKFPITLLTQKRAASNAATSELARSKGKRFAVLQEPAEDEKMNVGLMKELTGGDKIQARAIYKEPIEFKPQFKMILTCNQLPSVPSDDGGTWRRLCVVEFKSRFCDSPDPNNPYEFKIDDQLSKNFEIWKEHFMSMLIEIYKEYIVQGNHEPDEVKKYTKEYQRSNNSILEFVEQEIEKYDKGFINSRDLFGRFSFWAKENVPNYKVQSAKAFHSAVDNILGKGISIGGKVQGWKGYRFRVNTEIQNLDDLDNVLS